MAKMLMCPCGEQLVGRSDDDFLSVVDRHLQSKHDGRTYPGSMILAMGKDFPDDQVPA